MIKDINGLGSLNGSRGRLGSNQGTDSAPAQKTDTGNTSASSAKNEVALSNEAQSLRSLESKISDLPDVDMAKVDAIKTALAEGRFEIDNLILADKLIESDALLGE